MNWKWPPDATLHKSYFASGARKVSIVAISQTNCSIANQSKVNPLDILPTAVNNLL
jgi:hypothetical protein